MILINRWSAYYDNDDEVLITAIDSNNDDEF